MAIKAKYNPVEDRMELLINLDGEGPVLLVFTRFLWLRILRRLRAVLPGMEDCPEEPRPLPAKRNPDRADFSLFAPVMVSGFRLTNRQETAWSLCFLSSARKLRLALSPAGLKQCEELIFLQAERAGWDPQAALKRMHADALVKDVLCKAVKTRSAD